MIPWFTAWSKQSTHHTLTENMSSSYIKRNTKQVGYSSLYLLTWCSLSCLLSRRNTAKKKKPVDGLRVDVSASYSYRWHSFHVQTNWTEPQRKEEPWALMKNILVSWNKYRMCNWGTAVTSFPPTSHNYTNTQTKLSRFW